MAATNILVVDDDQDTCASLSDILLDLGYTVDTANDGLAALELSQRNLYRLALLDYKMPGMDGLGFDYYDGCRLRGRRATCPPQAHRLSGTDPARGRSGR